VEEWLNNDRQNELLARLAASVPLVLSASGAASAQG